MILSVIATDEDIEDNAALQYSVADASRYSVDTSGVVSLLVSFIEFEK